MSVTTIKEKYGGSYENLVKIRLKMQDDEAARDKLLKLVNKAKGIASPAVHMLAINYIKALSNLRNDEIMKILDTILLIAPQCDKNDVLEDVKRIVDALE